MSEFKPGDKVKCWGYGMTLNKEPWGPFTGRGFCTVIEYLISDSSFLLLDDTANGERFYIHTRQLEKVLVPREFWIVIQNNGMNGVNSGLICYSKKSIHGEEAEDIIHVREVLE